MRQNFSPHAFFDVSQFQYSDIFEGEEHVWNVIPNIGLYISSLFESGKVKGNYSENVYVHKTARIDKTARIYGPTIILENVQVGFHAFIHEHVLLDQNVVIGPGSEIKESMLLNTCKASHFNYISDSILGREVRLGAGAVVVNKRVDRQSITLSVAGQKIDTGLTKFGSIIGDESRIGANAVINPGTIIGRNSLVYPLESVFGIHTDGEIIK